MQLLLFTIHNKYSRHFNMKNVLPVTLTKLWMYSVMFPCTFSEWVMCGQSCCCIINVNNVSVGDTIRVCFFSLKVFVLEYLSWPLTCLVGWVCAAGCAGRCCAPDVHCLSALFTAISHWWRCDRNKWKEWCHVNVEDFFHILFVCSPKGKNSKFKPPTFFVCLQQLSAG